MRRVPRAVAAASLIAAPCLAAPAAPRTAPATQALVIRGATLVDGTGRPPLGNASVVTREGRIQAVGPAGRVRIPAGARVLVAPRGSTLLPGMIDMHVHSSVHPGMMPYFLASGVTSVRDLGCAEGRLEELKRYRSEAPSGRQVGPRLFMSGPPLDGYPRAAHWFPGPGARDEADAAAAVGDLHGRGVDLIKLYRRLKIGPARAAIEEAHRRNLPVTWDYQWNYRYLADAIRTGVDGLEHVFYSEHSSRDEHEQLAELIGARRVWVDPTLVAFRPQERAVTHDPDFAHLPGSLTRFWNRLFWPMETEAEFAEMKGFVRRVHRHGGRLLVGTDSPVKYVAPGYAYHHELLLLSECGLKPMQVLQAATRDAAAALRREKELGTVEVGKRADLVLIAGDPLADLRATRKVLRVVLDGRMHEPAALVKKAKASAGEAGPPLPPYRHGD